MSDMVTTKQLRAFGLIVGGGFTLIGLWPVLWHGVGMRLWALGIAALLILFGLVSPAVLQYPYRLWMALGHILGTINSKIILGALFYLLFTPIGLIRRLQGADPMQRTLDPQTDTYRLIRQARDHSHMKHQF